MTRKKLIEVALPLEAINQASAREKSIRHGHPSTLHLWWARRPLAAARAVIFASLVDDPDHPEAPPAFVEACRRLNGGGPNVIATGDTPRMRLFDFIERLVTWEATTDEALLNTARQLILLSTEGQPPPLLDPFAGGGSIPLEAQRLGLEAHASDLNPVAVMINKAQIEIPPRFAAQAPVNPRDRQRMSSTEGWRGAAGLAADVRYYGEWMREQAWAKIGQLYPQEGGETVIAWLWARTVASPNPAVQAHVPLVRSFILSKKKGRECWARPIVEGERVRFEVTPGTPPQGEDGTINRKGGYCLLSGEPMPFDYIRAEGKAGRMGAMLMAIVTEGQGGRSYYSPDAEQSRIAEQASPEWKPLGDIPQQALGFRVQLYGMDEYNKLFTPRQLVALTTFSDLVAEARARAYQDALAAGRPDDPTPLREGGAGALAYAEAVSVYLAFVFDKLVDLSSSLCRWEPVAQCPRGVFARQALPMVWDFAEANPLGKSSGSWQSVLDNFIHNFSRTFQMIGEHHKGVATQQEAQTINIDAATVISTDPPYYDNIGYADLSDFLYIWLRRILRSVYPDIFDTVLVPKDLELIAAPHRHVSKEASNQHFERGMVDTFTNIRRFVRPDYPLSVYYAFKQQEAEESTEDISLDDEETAQTSAKPKVQTASTGWETMLNGLIEAGFTIEGTYPIRTELSNRMIGMGTNALASSIVLVCRPRPAEAPSSGRRAFIAALRAELPAALQALQSGNIAPVDLAQASIGPGMAVYSRYSAVLEADGSPMSVRVALGLINAALDEYLAEQDGQIDPDTRFAVAWFEQFAFGEGEFGLADVLARAKNTSVAGAQAAGLLRAEKGRVALIPWSRYDLKAWNPQTDKRLTIWEVLHYLLNYLHHHGEVGAASLMNKLDTSTATEARQLAYRLYNICERKAWAEQARDYNALVLSWSGIQGEAQRLQAAQGDQIGTNQGLLFTND